MSDAPENNRRYYRLSYPDSLMPTAEISGHTYQVLEISEKGMRIRCGDFNRFRVSEKVSGEVTFSDGETLSIKGVIRRKERDHYVIYELVGITFNRLVQEQRLVISRYRSRPG